ncbi:hypothetical protein [Thioalkalivibrio paradoxus]|uniref:TIGR03016 family PEP-CTERM system-associated outer membrane protein n=1 Tax=Thioalkalivibrio paradoxus ARh 1 TaxID=713585 RepID=W0DTE8_9GAMM|nr:hypothetical protein [Thioalkalivibrio paradoxus]AHF00249.1 hypothetical protein THITH_13810 [Thioalkalivibrio paradoxus ARh 1]
MDITQFCRRPDSRGSWWHRASLGDVVIAGFAVMAVLGSYPLLAQQTDAATDEAAEAEASEQSPSSLRLSGTLDTSYRLRRFDGGHDQDLDVFFSLQADDIVKDRVDAAVSFYWHRDLDGVLVPSRFDPFLDLDQAADREFRLYTAYVNLNQAEFNGASLRLGRQFIDEIDFVHFDGASARLRPTARIDAQVFGGKPVSFFSGTSGETLYGARGDFRATPRARAAGTFYRYEGSEVTDDLLSLEGWYRWSVWAQSYLKYSWLNSDSYILQSDHFVRADRAGLDISVQTVSLLEPVSESTLNFNPYFPLLNSFTPFDFASVLAIKELGENASLRAGFDLRSADSVDDPVTAFNNRDFRRGILGFELRPTDTLTVALDAEYWKVDDDDRFTGFSGELEYRPTSRWTFTGGAEYGEYVQVYRDELALIFGEEKTFRITPDVITYFSRARWQNGRIAVSASLEYEDNSEDSDDWLSFQLRLGLRF